MAVYLPQAKRELKQHRKKSPTRKGGTTSYPKLEVNSKEMSIIGEVGFKTLTYKIEVKSEGTSKQSEKNYLTFVKFLEVDFSKTEDKIHNLPVKIKGKTFYYHAPNWKKNPVQLKCSCQDFRFNYERQLALQKALVGNIWRRYNAKEEDKEKGVNPKTQTYYKVKSPSGGTYLRKTPQPPEGIAFKNESDFLGFCKHIWSSIAYLQKNKLMTGISIK